MEKPKRTLLRAAMNALLAYDHGEDLTAPMEAIRVALRAERAAASIRARAAQDRKLTPEQRRERILRAEERAARLRALDEDPASDERLAALEAVAAAALAVVNQPDGNRAGAEYHARKGDREALRVALRKAQRG